MELLIATANPGKVREFREMLGEDRFVWRDLSQFTNIQGVEETGRTFRANACLKASHYARQTKLWALADDSGLAVDALGGKPGIHSARWAHMHGQGSGDQDNNKLLLHQLSSFPDPAQRTARFVCVLALSDPAGRIVLTAQDSVEGCIGHEPRGGNGFGYDPLFVVAELGGNVTAAELSAADKHRLSHRGKALRQMLSLFERSGVFARSPQSGTELTSDAAYRLTISRRP